MAKKPTTETPTTPMQNAEVDMPTLANGDVPDAMDNAEPDAAPPDVPVGAGALDAALTDKAKAPKRVKNAPVVSEISYFVELPDTTTPVKAAYRWDKLQPMQCFDVRGVAIQGVSRSSSVYAKAHPGYTVEMRKMSDDKGEFIRVFRTA